MHRAPPAGWPAQARLVRVVGVVTHARVEPSRREENIDHVWLTLDAGIGTPVEISINTLSRRNRDAGFDASVRVGRRRDPWVALPGIGVETLDHFSCEEQEARANFLYETLDRPALEALLIEAANTCLRVEAIGEPYHRRPIVGLHQIHSRRASCAVAGDVRGLDGALRFWFAFPREVHTLFFKFCGQP